MQRSPMLCFVFLVSCAPKVIAPAPAQVAPEHPQTAAKLVGEVDLALAEFKRANKPLMVDGVPSVSELSTTERAGWCTRLQTLAKQALAHQGDALRLDNACSITVLPNEGRQKVADVRIVFDVSMFFRKPYAAASYDKSSKTLFLPLASLQRDWASVAATIHEWRHANIHRQALAGDPVAAALQSQFIGPQYRPDAFAVDEVAVNLCDIKDAVARAEQPEPWRIQMAKQYADMLAQELPAVLRAPNASPPLSKLAGVAGATLHATGEAEGWVGGVAFGNSKAVLQALVVESSYAISAFQQPSPDMSKLPILTSVCSEIAGPRTDEHTK